MDLREKVEALLKKEGRQKKELAEYISISQGNLNRTLMGTSVDKEIKIAEFFGITRDELMNNDYSQETNVANQELSSFLMKQIADKDKKIEEKEKEINSLNRYIGKLETLLEQNGLDYTGIYENVKKGVV